jgi:predicted phage terminase large subunit-like protein
MKLERKLFDTLCRNNFCAFVYATYAALNPSKRIEPAWHVEHICYQVEEMVVRRGSRKRSNRLVINICPRTLKSFITSVCLPAWILGRDPTKRIICASYSRELAEKFSRDCRTLTETPFYQRLFPHTRLNPDKMSQEEFETTAGGSRLATSVGSTLTGRGGDFLLIDDPLKADDAGSTVAVASCDEWFRTVALSRLDSQSDGIVIVTMQRLNPDDLSGLLTGLGWPTISIPAIAEETLEYELSDGETYVRPAGEVLQPNRDSQADYDQIKQAIGSYNFATQYQQSPQPREGALVQPSWFSSRYKFDPEREKFSRIVFSCDTASKNGPHNDLTAIAVFGIFKNIANLLHMSFGHWTILETQSRIEMLAIKWRPNVVLIEDASSGSSLIQILKEKGRLNVIPRRPETDKLSRMIQHLGHLEFGRIVLPEPEKATWDLAGFERELFAFPNVKNDDRVDAMLLFLDWFGPIVARPAPTVAGGARLLRAEDFTPAPPGGLYRCGWI